MAFFIFDFQFSIAAAAAQKQLRPFLPETRPCGQIDPDLLTHEPECLPRSRTECRLINKERTAALMQQFAIAQTSGDTL